MKNVLIVLKNYLEEQPLARERKNKNRAIGNLLRENYPMLSTIPREYLADVVGDVLTMDRAWRKVLEDNEHLRGDDYNQKTQLEEKMELELGYTPGFDQDVKKLKTL